LAAARCLSSRMVLFARDTEDTLPFSALPSRLADLGLYLGPSHV
jgi:hypothetical protein